MHVGELINNATVKKILNYINAPSQIKENIISKLMKIKAKKKAPLSLDKNQWKCHPITKCKSETISQSLPI